MRLFIGNFIPFFWMDSSIWDWNNICVFSFSSNHLWSFNPFPEDNWIILLCPVMFLFPCCGTDDSGFFRLSVICAGTFLALSMYSFASCSLLILYYCANSILDRYWTLEFIFFKGLWDLFGFKTFFFTTVSWSILATFF